MSNLRKIEDKAEDVNAFCKMTIDLDVLCSLMKCWIGSDRNSCFDCHNRRHWEAKLKYSNQEEVDESK